VSNVAGTADDRLELRALAERYAIAVDRKDVDELVGLFLPDGGIDVYLRGREQPIAKIRGAELARVIDGVSIYADTLHFIGNSVAEVDGDEARGVTYCLAMHWWEDGEASYDETLLVTYDDEFVRTPEGWRFKLRRLTRKWTEQQAAGQKLLQIDRRMTETRPPA
jgi:hypothetical protein